MGLIEQDCRFCMRDQLGVEGIEASILDQNLDLLSKAFSGYRKQWEYEELPHFYLPKLTDDISGIENTAEQIRRNATDVLICGIGGSSLGGQTLLQASGWSTAGSQDLQMKGPRIHFIENLDPHSLSSLLKSLDLSTTHTIVISKSGKTLEIIALTSVLIGAYLESGLRHEISHRFTAITSNGSHKNSALANVCQDYNIKILSHLSDLGGRYSVFSNVGLLPASIAGLDIVKIREGAKKVMSETFLQPDLNLCATAVAAAANKSLFDAGKNIFVNMVYSDRLERYTRWLVQLFAESLGKDGTGFTPLAAIGPVDQHSQLQLFLDGPKDKYFTIVKAKVAGTGIPLEDNPVANTGIDYLLDKRVGDFVDAMQEATIESLVNAGQPVRCLTIDSVNPETIGALLMHSMLETLFTASLLNVNPFDQPAVEQIKTSAKNRLIGKNH